MRPYRSTVDAMSHSLEDRDAVERHLTRSVQALAVITADYCDPALPIRPGSALTGQRCLELFDAQLASRHLDIAARWLRAQGAGFYTIGSSGHEGNAGVAAALRLTGP